MTYASDHQLGARLGDLLAYGLVSNRLTDDEVEWIQLALYLLDCICSGLLLLKRPRKVDDG